MDDPYIPSKYSSATYMPSSFEERGAATPFTTPALSCARVRLDDRHNMVLLTPGFAGTTSVYVLPWNALPELFNMTLHDRAMFDAIQEAKATTPSAIRREALRVMASGLAGPEAQRIGRAAIAADRGYNNEIQAILLIYLLNALKIDVKHLASLDLGRTDVIHQAKQALAQAVTPLGVEAETLYSRMSTLADLLSFLGIANFGRPGRLRVLLENLKTFQEDMEQRSNRANTDASAFFGFASDVAKHTIALAGEALAELDQSLASLPMVVRDWETRYPKLLHLTSRLSWLLDGWDYALGFGNTADQWTGDDLWANLETLARMLPMVPKGEENVTTVEMNRLSSGSVQRRRVVAGQDWRTGELDREMVSRLEAAKVRAA